MRSKIAGQAELELVPHEAAEIDVLDVDPDGAISAVAPGRLGRGEDRERSWPEPSDQGRLH
jgi:hypothetical protein